MDAASGANRSGRVALVLAAVALLLAWAFFAGGASGTGSTAPLGTAAVLIAAALLIGWSRGRVALPRLDRAGVVAAAAATALVAWTGLSIWWSIAGDRSWNALANGIALLAFGVVGLAAGLLPGRPRRGRSRSSLPSHSARSRLGAARQGDSCARPGRCRPGRAPEGIDRLLECARAARRRCPRARALASRLGARALRRPAGALLLYAATLVILLTQSRAGLLAGVVVVALALWLSDRRVEAALLGLLATGPAVVVAGWAFTRSALVEDGGAQGELGSRTAGCSGCCWWSARSSCSRSFAYVPVERLVSTRRRDVVRGLVGAVALVTVVGAARPRRQRRESVHVGRRPDRRLGRGRQRLEAVSAASRRTTARCGGGRRGRCSGRIPPAARARARSRSRASAYRDDAANVTEPHSLPLQLLADTGLPALRARARPRRRSRPRPPGNGEEARARMSARPPSASSRSRSRSGCTRSSTTTSTSLPWRRRRCSSRALSLRPAGRPRSRAVARRALASVRRRRGRRDLGSRRAGALDAEPSTAPIGRSTRGDLSAAAASARRAQSLNPLSPDPLYARATVASRAGNNAAAEQFYEAGDPTAAGEPRHVVRARVLPADRAREPVQRVLRPQRGLHPRSQEHPVHAGRPAGRRGGRSQ